MKATAQMGGLTLLPCPFCGSLSGLHEDRNIFPEGPGWRVECEGACHAMTCYWHIATDAVAHWNLRQSLSLESVRSEARLDQGDKFMQAKLSGFNEGLEEAAKACEDEKVQAEETRQEGDYSYNLACIHCAKAIRALSPARVAEGRSVDPEFEHEPPETQGTWQERCSALYQVIGCMANMFGIFETSDDVSDALDVAAGRGDVEHLLPWPKIDLTTLVKAPESPAKEQPGEQNAAPGCPAIVCLTPHGCALYGCKMIPPPPERP